MSDKMKVERFLTDFKTKVQIWGVLFLDERGKNAQTLATLEITAIARERILKSLVYTDYSQGPISDKMLGGADLWVFGKDVKGHQIYIKITMGIVGASTICISFHLAEYPMKFPLQAEH
jgi:hypothetical protein